MPCLDLNGIITPFIFLGVFLLGVIVGKWINGT